MIFPALLTAYIKFQDAAEIARVRSFVQEAHVGLYGVVAPGFDLPGDQPDEIDSKSSAEFGLRDYSWKGTSITLDVRTGLVVGYHDGKDEEAFRAVPYGLEQADRLAPRRVTDAQAKELGQRFHAATRSPYGIEFFSIQDHQGSRNNRLSLAFTATWRGVPYDRSYAGDMEIGRDDGCLRDYVLRALAYPFPTPPPSLTARVSAAAARLTALQAALGRAGGVLQENPKWPFALCIGAPAAESAEPALASFLTPAEKAQVKAGEGRLVYSGQLVGGDPDDDHAPRFTLMIDALDGRVLSIRDWAYWRGGAGAKTVTKSLAVPTARRPWRVAAGSGPWSAPATAPLTPVSSSAPKGAKVLLTDGTLALAATFDPKTGLVGTGGKAYRPGPPLASLLRRTVKKPKGG